MAYTQTNWVDGATPLNRTNMMKIENELALLDSADASTATSISTLNGQIATLQSQVATLQSKVIPLATTLPGVGVEGQELILVDSVAAPTWHWHMRYLAATGYWIFVGGSPIMVYSGAPQGVAGGWNPYVPQLTIPYTGGYRFVVQSLFSPVTTQQVGLSIWYAGGSNANMQQLSNTPGAGFMSVTATSGDVVINASTLISVAGYTTNSANMQNTLMQVWPRAFHS